MKRHLIFCIALVAVMASCVKEPQIYRRLTDEESAIVPYQMGQTIRMLNQDDDTLCFTVVHDTTYVAYNYDDYRYHPSEKMIGPRPYFYAREVVLQSPPKDSCLLRCIVAPENVVTVTYEKLRLFQEYEELRLSQDRDFYYWHTLLGRTLPLNDLPTTTFTIGATTYENVHVDQGSYMADTTMVSYAWYYSEQQGLIVVKHGDYSLTLIP
jgi:hypothetical protein